MKLNFKKYKKLKRRNDFLEAEEILFNKEAVSKLKEENDLERLEISIGQWGLNFLLFFGIFILIFSLGFVVHLNFFRGNEFQIAAQKSALKSIPIIADRGLIFDSSNKVLVYNQEVFDLVFFPNYLPIDKGEREKVLNKIKEKPEIAEVINEQYFKKENSLDSLVIKNDLTREEAIIWESYFAGYPTIQVIRQNLRQYESPLIFSHILGYVGRVSSDDIKKNPQYSNFLKIGKTGIEAFYEDNLRGIDGEIKIKQNAYMEVLGQSIYKEPQVGNNLFLTIDSDLQEYSYKRLEQQINSLGKEKERGGVVIVTDPQTGKVLSLVSYPGYDINAFSKGVSQDYFEKLKKSNLNPLFNRTISGLYNPGSTIKPFMAIAALEEKIIDPNKKIETHGYLSLPNPYNPDKPSIFPDWRNNGFVDMKDAIARSSNVYFYIIGGGYENLEGLGVKRIKEYLEKFQFNIITGIDLPAENVAAIPDENSKDVWRIGDTYNISIGQGDLLTTPIRLITNLNSIINGGKIMRPYLLDYIKDYDKRMIFQNNPLIIKENFINPDNLKVVKEGMKETVDSPLGTAHSLVDLPFSVGGKSGSAQTAGNTKTNALFYAFAPYDNPKISVLILIEDVPEGSLNAIPVAKDILLWCYKNKILE
ncbi:MAG TPA: penicillin-binding protein 2 [Candidatus Paceibacterota bacterium]|nr:penicillin-binding protein 2 [Candidatus Paceibacterota bacterium]HPC37292.1 penicillin-binding protein 2 [Candidatus Paceibacterota bacterium]HRU35851.1 penicillin-binding protein 2 [Candidatus Paceibacterota bacterium]